MKNITKVIGLDTSTSCTGWALFIDGKYKKSGCIDKSKFKDTKSRMAEMCLDILQLLNQEQPNIVYWETPSTNSNPDTLRILSMIIGVVYSWCISNEVYYEEFRPSEWRKNANTDNEKLSRKRQELKKWSVKKVKELLDIEVNDDISDAILIVYGAINKYKEIKE